MAEIALVADEQYGHLIGALDAYDLVPHRAYIVEGAMRRDRVYDDEAVSVLDVQVAHRGELLCARRVQNLKYARFAVNLEELWQ